MNAKYDTQSIRRIFHLEIDEFKDTVGKCVLHRCCGSASRMNTYFFSPFCLFIYSSTKLDVSVFLFRLIFLRNSSHVTLGKLLRQCPVPVSILQHTSV